MGECDQKWAVILCKIWFVTKFLDVRIWDNPYKQFEWDDAIENARRKRGASIYSAL